MMTKGIVTLMMISDTPEEWSPFYHQRKIDNIDDLTPEVSVQQEVLSKPSWIKSHVQQAWLLISSVLSRRNKTTESASITNS
jgi:hypothetical protein